MTVTNPHFIRVVDAPGQPARIYPCFGRGVAERMGQRMFDTGFLGAVVEMYEGEPDANVERDPVKVWS